MGDASLKMSKNYFCLCSCIRGLGPVYAAYIHAYIALFLRLYVRRDRPTYTRSCPRMWALTRIRETSGKSSTQPVFTSFSFVSLHTFLSFLHPNITISFFLFSFFHQNITFSKFCLNRESYVIFLFFLAVIIPLCWWGKH